MKNALFYIFGTAFVGLALFNFGIATGHIVFSVRPIQVAGPQVQLAGLPNPYLAGR
jgi:hypothetical protein